MIRSPDEAVDIEATGNAVPVTKTTDGKTATGTVTLSAADTDSVDDDIGVEDVSKLTKSVSIDLNSLTFGEVGVYKYDLAWEISSTSAAEGDFTPSDTHRTVYLYVARTNDVTPTYAVTGAVMVDGETYNSNSKSNGTIVNFYMLNGDPDVPGVDPTPKANELTLANQVNGIMGNRTEAFDFTVQINTTTGKHYNVVFEKWDAAQSEWVENVSRDPIDLNDDDDTDGIYSTSVSLAHNERIHIYGLTNGDEYTITGPDKTSEGYSAPEISGGQYTNGTKVSFTTAEVSLTYTYTRNAIAPTGLVMNVAPYVLLVLVAAGAGYVFLRKREED